MAFRIFLGTILPVLLFAMVAAPLLWMDSSDRDLGGLLYMFGVILGLGCLLMGIPWLVWAIIMECVRRWAGTRFESTGVLLVYVSAGTVFGCLAGLCPGLWEFEWTREIWLLLALPSAVVGAIVSLLLWRFAGGNQ